MNGNPVIVVAGSLMLVTLTPFTSSNVIPVFILPITGPRNYGIGNYNDQNYQEIPAANFNFNPSGYFGVPNNLNLYSGINYNPNPYNGMVISDASFNKVAEDIPLKVAVTQRDNSMAGAGVYGNFFGLSIPAVTGGTAVRAAPLAEASTLKMVTTTTAPLKAPTIRAPLEDSTPYPLITGAHFTTGAPDKAAVTASL